MNTIQAIVYGIVQGIGEFLPISSTAHLKLIPWLFGWSQPDTAFDVALHLGTASAVILFFIKDWVRLIKSGFMQPKSTDGKLFWFIVIATIPGGLAGVLLDKYMEAFSNPAIIGVMLILMGVVLYLADKYGRRDSEIREIGLKRSVFVGLSQMLAIIPGVSRSGITITTGRALGLTRDAIARFTFLMSAPIILLDGLYHAKSIMHEHIDKLSFIVAILTAAIVGALSIKFLLGYIKKKGFGIFAVYRFVLGAFVIILYFLK
jgi:undecaprenyl-diphosphatase